MSGSKISFEARNELLAIAGLELLEELSIREKFSRDFFEYSPILQDQLVDCLAELVVKPFSIQAVSEVAAFCRKHEIPLTLRGAGTGNYGQCVPLSGGIVMLMGALKQIRHFDEDSGLVTVEPGCLLKDLDNYLSQKGRELRLIPSTWRSASVGGFLAGGSGGIGSVRWGFLRDPGHLLGLEVVTLEDPSRTIQLDAKDSEALNHAYGTNGIITALTLATAPAILWQEVTIDCEDWKQAVELVQRCLRSAIHLHVCTLLERAIVDQIPSWSGISLGKHRLLILVAPDGVSTLERLAIESGALFKCLGSENYQSGNGLRELTWNHTTLHMRANDSAWTYLQMLLPQPELLAMEKLKNRWGNDLLWHLEAVRQQGVQRLAALPIVRWKNQASLEALMNECKELGAVLFNPHVITVEDGGLGVVDVDQVETKKAYDPKGLLNPGKLKGWQ